MSLTSARVGPMRSEITTHGRIHGGEQRLVQAAATAHPEAKQIFDQGVAAELSYDDIARDICKRTGYKKRPLVPVNTGWFRVQQADFTVPGAAQRIIELYADDDGRLRRFPVEFISDDLGQNFREQFIAYSANERFRWSEESADGLLCMRQGEVERARRRRWGGRGAVVDRKCDPNDCPFYQDIDSKTPCSHYSTLYFTIPGAEYGIFKLTFKSLYSSAEIPVVMEQVRMLIGRIRGLINRKPIFWLSKQQRPVTRMDWATGKATKVNQWLITLTPDFQAIAEARQWPAIPHMITSTGEDTDEEVEPPALADPATVAELRKSVQASMAAFDPPWTPDDLKEFLTGNGFTVESMKDPKDLGIIDEMLRKASGMDIEDTPF